MEGMIVLSLIYWVAVGVIFLIGMIKMISALSRNEPAKPGLKLIIAAVIMVVIGAGACAAILGGISIR